MKCVTLNFLILILIILITFCGYQIFSKNFHYYATINNNKNNHHHQYAASGLYDDNDEYNYQKIIRQIPDTRDSRCPRHFEILSKYNAKISIIITYHNESLSNLLLTIYSIYKRTSLNYLQEIIIIDDYSDNDFIIKKLQNLSKSSLKLLKPSRNVKRLGLIKSRNLGANLAWGNYLMFMDSHCEVNEQWLEPLLETVITSKMSKVAVSPILDNIDADTLQYKSTSSYLKGGFDWNLHFHWITRDKTLNPIEPFRSPTFAGGIFLISRNWFFKLKAFNTRLEIWGGESLEFSLKLWLCGGDGAEIKIVPCSRIGHIFRKEHIFKFPDDNGQLTYLRNSKIIAETWLDHYKYYFYNLRPEAKNIILNSSLAEDKHFKESMNCHSFQWYLQNIFPELRNSENYTAYGILASSSSVSTDLCLHQEFSENHQSILIMMNCYAPNITNWYLLKETSQLHTDKGLCLNIKPLDSFTKYKVILENCLFPREQSWQRFGLQLRHVATGLCLEITVEFNLTANRCRKVANTMQYFKFERELEKF